MPNTLYESSPLNTRSTQFEVAAQLVLHNQTPLLGITTDSHKVLWSQDRSIPKHHHLVIQAKEASALRFNLNPDYLLLCWSKQPKYLTQFLSFIHLHELAPQLIVSALLVDDYVAPTLHDQRYRNTFDCFQAEFSDIPRIIEQL